MYRFIVTITFMTLLANSIDAQIDPQIPAVRADYDAYLSDLYVDLHAHPELSFLEVETAKKMAGALSEIGFEVSQGIGGHGVVGVFENGAGPTVLVRADMDALPVLEETGLPYASAVRMTDITGQDVPVMHACGHDVHMTVWVGAARQLIRQRDKWSGTLVFIAQPAEERSGGAKAMIADGLFTRFPRPDYALALHVKPDMPAGQVGWCPEYALANVDMMKIVVYGEGGHGAYPHTTIDPIALSARLILDLQTIVSREISPLEPAVVTVGSIHGGTKGNVIPNEVTMELTMRSYTDAVRDHIIEAIERKCRALAKSVGLPESKYPKVVLRDEYTPSLYNDPALNMRLAKVMESVLGADQVYQVDPVMAGEDFGRYGRTEEKVPIMLFWLGAVKAERFEEAQKTGESLPSLHSSTFAPDADLCVPTGVRIMTAAVIELLQR